jgi:hypothetical protein
MWFQDLVRQRIQEAAQTGCLVLKVPCNVTVKKVCAPSIDKQIAVKQEVSIYNEVGQVGGAYNSVKNRDEQDLRLIALANVFLTSFLGSSCSIASSK